jgi:hypothetical protein
MVALFTDEQQSFLFDGCDVAVTAAELGRCVNDHGDLLMSNPGAKAPATSGAYSQAFYRESRNEIPRIYRM